MTSNVVAMLSHRTERPRHWLRDAIGLELGLLGLLLWYVAARDADFLKMNAFGLVSVLGWPYFVGLALIVTGFTLELLRSPLRPRRLSALLAFLVIALYGTACVVEPIAALTDSWVHAGFIQYIVNHGHVLNGYDARFSWPGGFALGAALVAFVGQGNADAFLRFFPLVIELAYLAPLLVIARYSGVSKRAAWLGVALYYATNWIYQDYFSPQALNYLFFLVIIAVVLACWQPKVLADADLSTGPWRRRLLDARALVTRARFEGRDTISNWSPRLTLGALILVSLIALASAISHQLTPYALVLALAACLVTRRLGRPELVVLVAVFSIGWLSLGASNYWAGHLQDIFGSFGQIGSTLGANVASRVSGNANHLLVVKIRILMTGGIFFLAGVGFLRRFCESRTLEALAGAPFLLLVAQSYGGEGLLRVVLYGLPFTGLLAASAVFPLGHGRVRALLPSFGLSRHTRAALTVVTAVVVLGFSLATTVVRGGNDAYESFSKGELLAVDYAYGHLTPGQTIGVIYPNLPIGQRDIGSVSVYSPTGGGPTPTLKNVIKFLNHKHPTLIILSQSQEAWGEQVADYPFGWEDTLEASLLGHGYHIAAQWRTATVLRS